MTAVHNQYRLHTESHSNWGDLTYNRIAINQFWVIDLATWTDNPNSNEDPCKVIKHKMIDVKRMWRVTPILFGEIQKCKRRCTFTVQSTRSRSTTNPATIDPATTYPSNTRASATRARGSPDRSPSAPPKPARCQYRGEGSRSWI